MSRKGWCNGEFLDEDQIHISPRDIGVLRGYGVFDYLRTYRGVPFHLEDHLIRFFHSMERLRLEIPFSLEDLKGVILKLVQINGFKESSIRLVCTGGESPNGLMPGGNEFCYILVEPQTKGDPSSLEEGIGLITYKHIRYQGDVKTNNYIAAIDALKKAKLAGAFDALYMDDNRIISECTRSNIFFFKEGCWHTPQSDILKGITRHIISSLIPPGHLIEGVYSLDDLLGAEEVFISSSNKEVLPVIEIDHKRIGDGKLGYHTKVLQECFEHYKSDPSLWASQQKERPYGSL